MKLKRFAALISAAVLALSMFSACNDPEQPDDSGDPAPEVNSLTSTQSLIYREKKLDINIMDGLTVSSGRIYYEKSAETTDDADNSRKVEIHSANSDGEDKRLEGTFELNTTIDAETNRDITETLITFAADGKGALWGVIQANIPNDADAKTGLPTGMLSLVKLNADGTTALDIDLSEIDESKGFYPTKIALDTGGNVFLQTFGDSGYTIFVFDGATGNYLFSSHEENIFSIAVTAGGAVVYLRLSGSGYTITELDAVEKRTNVLAVFSGATMYDTIFDGFGQYDLFALRAGTIYGLKLAELSETAVLSFSDSNINTLMSWSLYPVSEMEFLLAKYDFDNLVNNAVTKLTYDPDAKNEKLTITVGVTYANNNIDPLVEEFNLKSRTTRIEIVRYYEDNDSSVEATARAMEKLDLDILQGKAPDIISFMRLDPKKYISKGVLADLTDMFNNDTRLKREDFFENVIYAGMSDGRLYHVIPYFNASMPVGKTSLFGDGSDFTIDKLNGLLKEYPNSEIAFGYSGSYWLRDCISATFGSYIDWEAGTCSFDNADFITLLESAKAQPIENNEMFDMHLATDATVKQTAIENCYRKLRGNEALLDLFNISDVRCIRDLTELFGEEVSFLGFPSPDGAVTAVGANCDFGINEASPNKAEAWEFISMLLTNQQLIESFMGGAMWTNRATLEKQAAIEMTPVLERELVYPFVIWNRRYPTADTAVISSKDELDPEKYANYHLTEDEVSRVRTALESATLLGAYDTMIWSIVKEEADIFLGGARTAEETAKIIQSRVSIYMSEQS